ncbi:MAG: hypothetical protein ACRELV_01400, partial [Longimicrobiales bacterium]
MMQARPVALCLLLPLSGVIVHAPPLHAQEPTLDRPLRVYLDCQTFGCDFDYFRTELDWVDWVRDRQVADVHALVTGVQTGSGGREFQVALLGRSVFSALGDTVSATSGPTATEFERRNVLLGALTRGLLPYALRTSVANRLDVELTDAEESETPAAAVSPADDPWNFWVFEIGVDGSIDGESRERSNDLSGSVEAIRTTEDWKLA